MLYVTDNVTVKVAPQRAVAKVRERINSQAAWLIEHRCGCLPRVFAKWNGGYAMETLKPIVVSDRVWVLERIQHKLIYEVWKIDTERPLLVKGTVLMGHHREYVHDLVSQWAPHLAPKLMGWMKGVSALTLSQVNIHGDPTIDNTMMRPDGSLVITDPIPASPRMPALLAADLGKMLQSAYGYEDIKAGREPDFSYDACYRAVIHQHDPSDVQAAKYFLAVHLLRLIPYQKHSRDKFLVRLEALVARGVNAL